MSSHRSASVRDSSGDTGTHAGPDMQEPTPAHFRAKEIFDKIEALLADDGEGMVARVKGVYLFRVKAGRDGAEGAWILDAKNGAGAVEFNGKGNYKCFLARV